MTEWLIIFIMGSVIGVISAFLGLGGGILIVPILPEVAGITAKEAIATSLFTIFLVVANNCYGFHKKKLVIWKIAFVIGPLTAIGAFASGLLVSYLSDGILRSILAALVTVFLARAFYGGKKPLPVDSEIVEFVPQKFLGAGLVGIVAGLLSGISGIGAGLVVSPLLMNLRLAENKKVAPTANGVMLFTTFFGALAYVSFDTELNGWVFGYLHLDKALLLASGAFITSFFARRQQHKMPAFWRKAALTTLLGLLTLKMWSEVYQIYFL